MKIVRADRSAPLPLSFSQSRLWYLEQLYPGSLVYCASRAFRLSGPLDADALERAFRTVLSRHEVLRTNFETIDGEPVQVISGSFEFALPVIDLSGMKETARSNEVRRILNERDQRPFDLRRDLKLRACLLRLGTREHVLALETHHITSDAWSRQVFYRELEELYRAYRSGMEPKLNELPIQYADYAVWQRDSLGEIQPKVEEWRQRLSGAEGPLKVPGDRRRPAIESNRGGMEATRYPTELCEAVGRMCREEGATPFMGWLSGFLTLLYRYTGKERILVGFPIAGRTQLEVGNLIGFFANTLVLQGDLRGQPSFRELLGRVKEEAFEAYGYQDIPFEKLVEEYGPDRDLSHAPVFQVMFAYQNVGDLHLRLEELQSRIVPRHNGTSKFDLSLFLSDQGQDAEIEFNSDIFDPDTARRIFSNLRTVMEGAVREPEQSIARLPVVGPEERHRLLVEFNNTNTALPEDPATVHGLFERQVRRSGERTAATCRGENLTYDELNLRGNQVATRLIEAGVEVGDPVTLFVERSLNMLAGIVGILKAGGCYVPLDPANPDRHLELVLDDVHPDLLLTQSSLLDRLPAFTGERLLLDQPEFQDGGASPDGNSSAVFPAVASDDLAYILYTSGSTGSPKGVEVLHRGVVNILEAFRREVAFGPEDAMPALATYAFDISVMELFLPLIAGGRTVIASREDAADGRRLQELIVNNGITVMQGTPATWQLLLDAGWEGKPDLRAWSGGDTLPARLAGQLMARCQAFWNFYGPTETTIYSTLTEVVSADSEIPIGRPAANTTIRILDQNQQLVPIGIPGEICIGGAGVARGYRNLPELTNEKFVPDAYGADGARLYRTGDLGRWRLDGQIEFLGRNDDQIKIRGFRIDCGEVEHCLTSHPTVSQSAVRVHGDETDKQLTAYVVPEGSGVAAERHATNPVLDLAELRRHVEERLPPYMAPNRFVILDSLPLTARGKVDRDALPEMEVQSAPEAARGRAPASSAELLIAKVWKELLDLRAVVTDDYFFGLGGHSLQAMRAIARLEKEAGIRLTPMEIMTKSLGELAVLYESRIERPAPEPKGAMGRLAAKLGRYFR